MHQVLLNNLKKTLISLICLLILISGCKAKIEKMTVKEWIVQISESLDIKDFKTQTPYYLNIDKESIYYSPIQALVEWGVIDTKYELDLDQELTREFVAYTLTNLYTSDLTASQVKDSNKSKYPRHIEKAVAIGLFNLDSRGCFNPKRLIDKQEALSILDKVVKHLNYQEFEKAYTNINWKDDLNIAEITPINYDAENEKAYFNKDISLNKGDIIKWENEALQYYKKVEDIKELQKDDPKNNFGNDVVEVSLSDPLINELFKDIEAYNTFDLNFTDAKIEPFKTEEIDGIDEVHLDFNDATDEPATTLIETSFNDNYEIVNVSNFKTGSFKFEDYDVKYSVNSNSIDVTLSKKDSKGNQITGKASLFDVRPSYKWKYSNNIIEEAYLKLDFKTNEYIELKKESYTNKFSDFKNIDPTNFIQTLFNSFKDEKDMLETIIPICKISVPISGAPMFTLVMQLQVEVSTSGRIKLNVSNQNTIGMAIVNNKIRTFSDVNKDIDFIVKASAKAMLGVYGGLNIANMSLMDIGVSAGVSADLQSVIHLYDSKGKVSSIKSEYPTDLLDELSIGNDDVKICGDLKGGFILDVNFNSSKTTAYKLGLNKKLNVLNPDNSPLFPGFNKHLENWQFVEKCTRNDKFYKDIKKESLNSEKIQIDDYSLIINVNETSKINLT